MTGFTTTGRVVLSAWAVLAAATGGRGSEARASAFREITFESQVLHRPKTFSVVSPARPPAAGGSAPVLFLLHGRGRTHHSLLDDTRSRALLAQQEFFIVLPDGEDGWYINSPVVPADRYNDYLEEVLAQAQAKLPLSSDPAHRALAGWSMGGFGAVSFAAAHPGAFGAVVGIIGLLDFPRAEDLPEGQNYQVPVPRFGSDAAVWRQFNPIEHLDRLRGSRLLVITATGAFDRTMNQNFAARARTVGLDLQFKEIPGAHTLDTVIAALPDVFRFVQEQFAVPAKPIATSSLSTP